MAAKNDVTGDSIQSRPSNSNYSDNYDRIFRKPSDTYKDTVGEPKDTANKLMELPKE